MIRKHQALEFVHLVAPVQYRRQSHLLQGHCGRVCGGEAVASHQKKNLSHTTWRLRGQISLIPGPSRLVIESVNGIKLMEKQGWAPSARWDKPFCPEERSVFDPSEEGFEKCEEAVKLAQSIGQTRPFGWWRYPRYGKFTPWGGNPRSDTALSLSSCLPLYHSSGRKA